MVAQIDSASYLSTLQGGRNHFNLSLTPQIESRENNERGTVYNEKTFKSASEMCLFRIYEGKMQKETRFH